MPLDFFELVQKLDETEIKSLHHELVSRNLYNNLIDISDVGDDINQMKNKVPVALQRLGYEDIHQIAPESIKKAIKLHIDSETKTTEIPDAPEEPLPGQEFVQSRQQEIENINKRLGVLTAERGKNNRILPQHRDEVYELITKLNKVYKIPISEIAQSTKISVPTVSRTVKDFLNKHPFEQHRWLAAAEKKAIVKADETLTKAAGKTANELVETYLSLGQWTMETYTLMALSLGMSVRELVELGIDSYDPAVHLEMLEMQREKDKFKSQSQETVDNLTSYITTQNLKIQELETILIKIMIDQNPEITNLINMGAITSPNPIQLTTR